MQNSNGQVLLMATFLAMGIIAEDMCDTSSGWQEYDGQCYYISTKQEELSMTWDSARDFCHENGGDLVSILSSEENQFIQSMANNIGIEGVLWIGYTRRHDMLNFKWVDNSAKGFENWGPDQPTGGSDWAGQKHCAYMRPFYHGNFSQVEGIDTVKHLLNHPSEADGIDTFSFFYDWNDNIERCQQACFDQRGCISYTFIRNADPIMVWKGECLGRSGRYSTSEPYIYAVSGFIIGTANHGLWYNDHCAAKMGFVCKKEPGSDLPVTPQPTVPVEGYCPWPWFDVRNRCFRVVSFDSAAEGKTWDEAFTACRSMSTGGPMADLASFHNVEDMAVITSMMQEVWFDYWIGLRKVSTSDWGWADNTQTDYHNWKPTYPDSFSGDCAATSYYPPPIGGWQNYNCNAKKGYICYYTKDPDTIQSTPQSTSPHTCPPGYWPHRSACYKKYDAQVSFYEAHAKCLQDNADLASIQDESDNAMVFRISGNEPVWIGLIKDYGDTWKWTNGWPTNFLNWASDPNVEHNCTILNEASTWDSDDCEISHYGFVCRWTTESPPTTPANMPGSCPYQWTGFGSFCYFHVLSCGSWAACEQSCAIQAGNHHGHLASIHSNAENEFLYALVENGFYDAWIGLSKKDYGHPHNWTDGSLFEYSAWAPGQPSDGDGSELCVYMHSNIWPGLWTDYTCTHHTGALCKAEKVYVPTPTPVAQTMKAYSVPEVAVQGRPFTLVCEVYSSLAGSVWWRHPPGTSGDYKVSTNCNLDINNGSFSLQCNEQDPWVFRQYNLTIMTVRRDHHNGVWRCRGPGTDGSEGVGRADYILQAEDGCRNLSGLWYGNLTDASIYIQHAVQDRTLSGLFRNSSSEDMFLLQGTVGQADTPTLGFVVTHNDGRATSAWSGQCHECESGQPALYLETVTSMYSHGGYCHHRTTVYREVFTLANTRSDPPPPSEVGP